MNDTGEVELGHGADKLRDEVTDGRFELARNGQVMASMRYEHLRPNRYALLHTEVDQAHRGQGIGRILVEAVLDEIRSRQGTVTAICPFVADHLAGNERYGDLVDARHPGFPDRAAAERGRATPS